MGETTWRFGDRVLPGVGRIASGRPGGWWILGYWLLFLGVAATRFRAVAQAVTAGGAGDRLAVAVLIGGLALCWISGNRSTAPAGRWRESWLADGMRGFGQSRRAMTGLGLLVTILVVTLLTPLLAPSDPGQIETTLRLLPPSAAHPMGTDDLGRDVMSRVLYGARISLTIGFLAVTIAVVLGTAIGGIAGYAGGWIDVLLMRIVDLFLSFPRIVLLVTIVAVLKPSIGLIVAILGLTGWMGVSRLVRGEVLSLKQREYVQAARALGFSAPRILGLHVLPGALTPVIVAATLGIGNAILAEAALSYLGLGVPPDVASWGNIIRAGADRMLDAWWIALFPGLAIVFTVMSFNLLGDGLRDALDPRSRP